MDGRVFAGILLGLICLSSVATSGEVHVNETTQIYTIPEGETVDLIFEHDPSSNVRITYRGWGSSNYSLYVDASNLTESAPDNIDFQAVNASRSVLTIAMVTASDAGRYCCRVPGSECLDIYVPSAPRCQWTPGQDMVDCITDDAPYGSINFNTTEGEGSVTEVANHNGTRTHSTSLDFSGGVPMGVTCSVWYEWLGESFERSCEVPVHPPIEVSAHPPEGVVAPGDTFVVSCSSDASWVDLGVVDAVSKDLVGLKNQKLGGYLNRTFFVRNNASATVSKPVMVNISCVGRYNGDEGIATSSITIVRQGGVSPWIHVFFVFTVCLIIVAWGLCYVVCIKGNLGNKEITTGSATLFRRRTSMGEQGESDGCGSPPSPDVEPSSACPKESQPCLG